MSVSIINPGVGGITVETDPTALKLTGGAISGDLTVAQKVGIGGVVPVGATNKLAVHNGNIVFTAGFGLAFGDGTQLNTAVRLAQTHISNTFFGGKQTFTPVSGVAGINIGIGGTDAASNAAGDMWITTGGQTLNYRDANNSWRQVLTTSTAGAITVSSTSPALRVTQTGTGHSLLVEDSTNPDSTPFVITNDGTVAIGTLTPVPGRKVTISGHLDASNVYTNDVTFYNGNFSFSIETAPGPTSMGSLTQTDYPLEVFVRIGANTYAMPARSV